jgi:hypothetical protein
VALSNLFSRLRRDDAGSESRAPAVVQPSNVLGRFLATLKARRQPVLLDLASGTGSNVSFFGEELGCKIFIEDVVADIEHHAKTNTIDRLSQFFATRFTQEAESVDGILCWDVFDYLDKPSARALAAQLSRILKPEGVVLAFFATAAPAPGTEPTYARFVVADQRTLHSRPQRASRAKQRPHENRDIQLMFAPLTVAEQFLLKSRTREVLLRKPAPRVPQPPTA